VAFLTTVSTFPEVLPTLSSLIHRGIDVISSTEELFYPYYRYAEQASALDELAKQHGVSVLGTGINPGFIMDTLVLVLTGACQHINRIAVTRVANASGARPSLQRKLGLGLTKTDFAEYAAQGRVGVVGLIDSLAFLAHVLQWHMDDFKERLVPVIADRPVRFAQGQVEPGQVCGVRYVVKGISHGKEVISFDLRMYLEAESVRDTIYIEGTPTLEMTIKSTNMGDVAAAGLLVNMSPLVHQARPGLLTMVDLPLPHWQR
jgi:4-hydroxy-tetrahydrodipicolinate reductase